MGLPPTQACWHSYVHSPPCEKRSRRTNRKLPFSDLQCGASKVLTSPSPNRQLHSSPLVPSPRSSKRADDRATFLVMVMMGVMLNQALVILPSGTRRSSIGRPWFKSSCPMPIERSVPTTRHIPLASLQASVRVAKVLDST